MPIVTSRDRADRCPGVLRPWIADDGALVRLRLVGGRLAPSALARLLDVAERHGDGTIALTRRANLQVRGLPAEAGALPDGVVAALAATGLVPSRSHELVRNLMVSPLSGRSGGRADLRPVADRFDALLRADADLADLSARFLVVLDDGRGDLVDRTLDLGAVAVDADHAQVRAGRHWGEVVPLDVLPDVLGALAHRFRRMRPDVGTWHVDDLPDHGAAVVGDLHARDLRTQVRALPLPPGPGRQDDGRWFDHVPVADGLLRRPDVEAVLARAGDELVVTPHRSLLLPDLPDRPETP
jgi:precorrin-3B synthase